MTVRKNWFFYLTLLLFEFFTLCALACLVLNRAEKQGGIPDVAALLGAGAVFVLVFLLARRIRPMQYVERFPRNRLAIIEAAGVCFFLLLGIFLRLMALRHFHVQPDSDYAIYYRAAALLAKDGLAGTDCAAYISAYPHVFGYPYVLSLLFRITGPSYRAGLLLNLCSSMLGVFFTYRAARLLGGRLCGFLALMAGALWPSQIVYGAVLASEPVFTAALMLIFWLFVRLTECFDKGDTPERRVFLCVLLGVFTALAGALRPMALILLIALLLCLLFRKADLAKPQRVRDGRFSRLSRRGWAQAAMIIVAYFLCARIISGAVTQAVGRPLTPSGAAFGYNLMVGVNTKAEGAWNREDADFFNRILERTDDPRAAHRAALGVGLDRIRANPRGVIALGIRKFAPLWENDDYGVDWVTVFLDQQGGLTSVRKAALERLRGVNNWFYGVSLIISALYGFRLRKRPGSSPVQALMLLFIGTVLLHLVLETQNRYHYFILQAFMILSALGVSDVLRRYGKTKQ